MNTKITRIALIAVALFTPALASAAVSGSLVFTFGNGAGACTTTLCSIASTFIYLINSVLVPLLFAVAFIMFLYGVAKAYIFSGGNEESIKEGHKLILWGLIGFVVMISLWGLVNIIANTFGLGGQSAPRSPTSY